MSDTKKTQGQNAGSCKIELATILDKKDPSRSVSVAGGFVEMRYYESILQDGIQASFMFSDAGNSIDGKTVSEGLPLNGGETFQFKAKDNNETTLEFEMIVGNDTNISSQTTKSLVILPLSSKAFAVNDTQNVRKFFPKQKISDHVKTLMTEFLKTEKTLDVEDTSNSLKEYGLNRKPYYMLNTFAKKAQPSGGEGQTAGYFFFETSEKMIFKSIDSFFDEEKNPRKRSIIYNQGPEKNQVPEGYDYKALTYDRESASKLEMSKMGAFSTASITFDPINFNFKRTILSTIEDIVENVDEAIKPLTSAAKELATFNPSLIQEFSRTTMNFLDTGAFGETANESKENNFDFGGIYNQSIMRYNQVFASQVNITIQGDFSLHAGDMIFFDAPSPQAKPNTENDEIDKQAGGLYIIASLCHYITPDRTLTKLCLIRDSFGRQGNHAKR
jgi:hypothetical protein